MSLYRQFSTIAAAQAYCDQQTALMVLPPGSTTQKWADPMLLTDGTFVVPAYQDNSAVPWDARWEFAQIQIV